MGVGTRVGVPGERSAKSLIGRPTFFRSVGAFGGPFFFGGMALVREGGRGGGVRSGEERNGETKQAGNVTTYRKNWLGGAAALQGSSMYRMQHFAVNCHWLLSLYYLILPNKYFVANHSLGEARGPWPIRVCLTNKCVPGVTQHLFYRKFRDLGCLMPLPHTQLKYRHAKPPSIASNPVQLIFEKANLAHSSSAQKHPIIESSPAPGPDTAQVAFPSREDPARGARRSTHPRPTRL